LILTLLFTISLFASEAKFSCTIGEDNTGHFYMYSIEDESMDKIEFSFLNLGVITLDEITEFNDESITLAGNSTEAKVESLKLNIQKVSIDEIIHSELIIKLYSKKSELKFDLNCKELL